MGNEPALDRYENTLKHVVDCRESEIFETTRRRIISRTMTAWFRRPFCRLMNYTLTT